MKNNPITIADREAAEKIIIKFNMKKYIPTDYPLKGLIDVQDEMAQIIADARLEPPAKAAKGQGIQIKCCLCEKEAILPNPLKWAEIPDGWIMLGKSSKCICVECKAVIIADARPEPSPDAEELKSFHDKVEILVWGEDFTVPYTDEQTLGEIQAMFS